MQGKERREGEPKGEIKKNIRNVYNLLEAS